jgi:hypothetical protein
MRSGMLRDPGGFADWRHGAEYILASHAAPDSGRQSPVANSGAPQLPATANADVPDRDFFPETMTQ